jgi:hypothetical protein
MSSSNQYTGIRASSEKKKFRCSLYYKGHRVPPPCLLTSAGSMTATFLLSSRRSSGVIILSLLTGGDSGVCRVRLSRALLPVLAGWEACKASFGLEARPDVRASGLRAPGEGSDWVLVSGPGLRWRTGAAGKLYFLSIASTFFVKRLNKASALLRIGIRSMVLESSLTD